MLHIPLVHGNIDYQAVRRGRREGSLRPFSGKTLSASEPKADLKRILYIEDDEDIAAIGCMILEGIGNYDVRLFTSGESAIDAYDDVAPDLILIDVMMPVLDGPATIMHLMQVYEEQCAPFIFMTARAQLYEQESYRALGALDVIVKPFNPMTLCQDIQDIWDKHHAA